MRTHCPFLILLEYRGRPDNLDCVYMDKGDCKEIESCPGNGDAWCSQKIEYALDNDLSRMEEAS